MKLHPSVFSYAKSTWNRSGMEIQYLKLLEECFSAVGFLTTPSQEPREQLENTGIYIMIYNISCIVIKCQWKEFYDWGGHHKMKYSIKGS